MVKVMFSVSSTRTSCRRRLPTVRITTHQLNHNLEPQKAGKLSLHLLYLPLPLTLVCLCLAEASLRCLPLPPACPCPPPARFTTLSALFIIFAKLVPSPSKGRSSTKKQDAVAAAATRRGVASMNGASQMVGGDPAFPCGRAQTEKKTFSFCPVLSRRTLLASPAALAAREIDRPGVNFAGFHITPHRDVIGQASPK